MTSTENRTVPSSPTFQQLRREWITEIVEALEFFTPPVVWRATLELIRSEGPGLASPDNEWWARRLRWVEMQVARGSSPRLIVTQVLLQMMLANEDPALRR